MSSIHRPVLWREVIAALEPKPNQNFVDCTVGAGGHAEKILEMNGPAGKLLGLDWDAAAVENAKLKLEKFKSRAIIVKFSYLNVADAIYKKNLFPISGFLLDLGLSSDQLQNSGRGFSFQSNEPLDMRFSPEENPLTAREIINRWSAKELEKIFLEYGEERRAKRLATAIVESRRENEINSTLELVQIIMRLAPARKQRIHPATKIFQALRIAVNDELNNLSSALKKITEIAEPGARIAVITFHSLEDRIVKNYFRECARGCVCPAILPECRCARKPTLKILTKKPIVPTADEIAENFRSRSAKLRVAQKI